MDSHPEWMPVILPAYFVTLWLFVSFILSHIGGWATLAKQYRLQRPFTGAKWHFQSGQMRLLAGYSRCLTAGCNTDGLYLGILFLFRFAHPPLFLPWNEISVQRKKIWLFGDYVRLELGHELQIPLWIRGSLADKLKGAAGGHWPVEEV